MYWSYKCSTIIYYYYEQYQEDGARSTDARFECFYCLVNV